jgi:hypothetical protein
MLLQSARRSPILEIGNSESGCRVLCPQCRSGRCRRSRRRSWKDYAIGLTGLRPWRCRVCELRFFAWSVAFAYLRFAHCRRCGNLDLQRISREHATGFFAFFFRLAHMPAYRCAPCRHRFFSLLPHRRIRPADALTADPQEAKQAEIAGAH